MDNAKTPHEVASEELPHEATTEIDRLVAKCDQYLVENAELEAMIVELKDENAELRERVKVPGELVDAYVAWNKGDCTMKECEVFEDKATDWVEHLLKQEGGK